MSIIISIVAFILVFSVLVLVHELGHFSVAKFFKVKVEEFGLGLPPKAKRLFKKGDTEYTLNWIPFGGFVRMLGENDIDGEAVKDKRSFAAKPLWQKILIAAAGVIMNFLLAYILLAIMFVVGFKPLAIVPNEQYPLETNSYLISSQTFALENGFMRENPDFEFAITIPSVAEGSKAQEIGIIKDSALLSINGAEINTTDNFKQAYTNKPVGTNLSITLQGPDGQEYTKTLTKPEGPLGITLKPHDPYIRSEREVRLPFGAAIVEAGNETQKLVVFTFQAAGKLFGRIISTFSLPEDIGGPVQIASAVHDTAKVGIKAVILLTIILSVNLGVFNILPIPALDGGRIFFLLLFSAYEKIAKKPASKTLEVYIHYLGYIFLLLLILAVTYQDILRLFL